MAAAWQDWPHARSCRSPATLPLSACPPPAGGLKEPRLLPPPRPPRHEQVLKAHGHLLPPALEALAEEQRSLDREAARQLRASAEGAALVTVQAAAAPKPRTELQRTRSQQLQASLREPGARALLAEAAQLAGSGRVLAARARLEALLQRVGGGSLQELAALPPEALAAVLPPGSDAGVVGDVLEGAAAVHQALAELQDDEGWMVSRDDDLHVRYRHKRGTTVHRCAAGRRGCATSGGRLPAQAQHAARSRAAPAPSALCTRALATGHSRAPPLASCSSCPPARRAAA